MINKVPYSSNGNLQHFPENEYGYEEVNGDLIYSEYEDDDLGAVETKYGTWDFDELTRKGILKRILIAPVWKPNEPFETTLYFLDTARGRSAAYFIVEDEEGRTYSCFMTDVLDIIKNCEVIQGKVKGKWIIKKRGSNYGIGRFEKIN